MESRERELELQRYYNRLLKPLSLFPSKETPPETQKHLPQSVWVPQTPSCTQLTTAALCEKVTKRLAGSGLEARVSARSRLRLTRVILDELKCSWREPPTEPGLSPRNNLKLRQRLEAHVLLSSEQLFLHYLHLLVALTVPKGVFTEQATLTRLAANLARDCTLFLTSPDVYRCLLADFQTLLKVDRARSHLKEPSHLSPVVASRLCPIPWPHGIGFARVPCRSLNLNYLVRLSRPAAFHSKPGVDPLKELKTIPQLKKGTLWPPSIPQKKDVGAMSSQIGPQPSDSGTATAQAATFPQPPICSQPPIYSQPRRCQSMPSLREGWKLADELGLLLQPPRSFTPLVLVPESKPELAGDPVTDDLKQMMKKFTLECSRHRPQGSDLPPLLGALTRRPASGHRLRKLLKTLKALEEEEAFSRQDHQPPKAPPLSLQPLTVTLKLRNQLVVQAAAVRVSDRGFVDSFHVEGVGVLYNHLAGELDPHLVEKMDHDLFVGNDTREAYKELLSRVSANHLCLDQGPLIEPQANKDWSTFLSSALLRQGKQHRIINPELGNLYTGEATSLLANAEKESSVPSFPAQKSWDRDRQTKTASWMRWWKANLSKEDYFKYLSTQETDFLHVIFHMYEDEVPVEVVSPDRESSELQPPPPAGEEEEPWDFVPGEWDCNVVLQHGLGRMSLDLLGESYKIQSLQKRLERLWSLLEVPKEERLDMAIRYCSSARLPQLPALLSAWERALQPIQQRETLLARLEWFERQGSDPNRFFRKPDMGLSCRLDENRTRSQLQRKLSQVEASLVSLLEEIEFIFHEPVTFKGQRYLDKMKRDKVEMLYWLQQRRRMRHVARTRKPSHLQTAEYEMHNGQRLVAPENSPIAL